MVCTVLLRMLRLLDTTEQMTEIVGKTQGTLGERRLLKLIRIKMIDSTIYKGVTDLARRDAQDFAEGSHSGKGPRQNFRGQPQIFFPANGVAFFFGPIDLTRRW